MLLYTHRYFMWYNVITEWTVHDIFQVWNTTRELQEKIKPMTENNIQCI